MWKKASVFLSVILVTSYLAKCTWFEKPAPKRNFSEADLLIDLADMPAGWALSDSSDEYNAGEGEESAAFRNFYIPNAPYLVKAGEDIFRYGKIGLAEWNYKLLEKEYMTPTQFETTWQTPEGFMFSSTRASHWRFACTESTFSPTTEFGKVRKLCIYLAQYEEFIVNFGITMEVDKTTFITLAEVEQIIKTIDKKMSAYLAK